MTSTRTTPVTAALEPYFYPVESSDGTLLEAWTNDPDCLLDGPTVLLCNGLGTNAYAWPNLLDPDSLVRVVSWQHRGTGGSERPLDPERVEIVDFVADVLAVLDAAGITEPVPVIGWSMGVNTAFELALRHPERVSGIFAVAGVPGGTFATMLQPLHVPRRAAETVMLTASQVAKVVGPVLSPVLSRLPIGPRATALISHSGFMLPVADPELTAKAVGTFLTTPIGWYSHLALATHRHQRVPLSRIGIPVTFVAGRFDLLAGLKDIRTAADKLADVVLVEVPATHFVQMEHPDLVAAELDAFLDRVR